MTITAEAIRDRFRHHPPASDGVVRAHEHARARVTDLALDLYDLLPDTRERALALTALEEVLMRANQCIAIHEVEYDSQPPREG